MKISEQNRDKLFRYFFLLGSFALVALAVIGTVCYYIYPVFDNYTATAYELYPTVVIVCSVIILFLSLLTFLPSLFVFLGKNITPFSRGTWGVVMTIIALLGVIAYIVPLLLSGAI